MKNLELNPRTKGLTMIENAKFDNYPLWIVLTSNAFSIFIYAIGLYITFRIGWIFSFLFLTYILILEYRLIKYSCPNCYYWGKACGFGKGKISSWFFRKGDTAKFCSREMKWKDMIPDLLISLIPFIAAIILMILEFEVTILAASILLLLLTTSGNNIIRGKLTCRNCGQMELGCPAYDLFNKKRIAEKV